MRTHNILCSTLILAALALASASTTAHAGVFRFVAAEPAYEVLVGETVIVDLFLQEDIPDLAISTLIAENGLISLDVRVDATSADTDPATMTAFNTNDLDFNDPLGPIVTLTPDQLRTVLFQDPFEPLGVLGTETPQPIGARRDVYIGSLIIQAGNLEDQTTIFTLADDLLVGEFTLTLDGIAALDTTIEPGTFTVTTIIPEPLSIGIFTLGLAALTRRCLH
ncbi:hypothetical protein [Mucisphaera calidilacus]|uniref:PEP-CTERM protein-sorting domain-containing protein n=1 Tax=Mucisphaera calidilacus TaxID=2527982 RepID=A0A518BWT3_9BACT|nr:hypothetical protein [Mucisphaera calidilacus]QDU71440.1 hypothetical protein Pan265_12900 [Mucisphaera calidilacus]